ncbi:MAG: hypothetical protein K8S87_06495, partial [Planctomycetes bacterium]|nr:hypothetical protein [Planctomycetota bacterium]
MIRFLVLSVVSMMVLFLNSIVGTNFAQDAGISEDTANMQNENENDDDDDDLEKQEAFIKEMNEKALKIVLDWIRNLDREKLVEELKEIAKKHELLYDFKEKNRIIVDYLGFEKEYFYVNNLEFSFLPKIFERISYQCSKKNLSEVVTEICGDLNYVFPQIEGEDRFVICNFKNISRMGILYSIVHTHRYELFINDSEYEYSNEYELNFSMSYILKFIDKIIYGDKEKIFTEIQKSYKDTLSNLTIYWIAAAHMIIENADELTEMFLKGVKDDLEEFSKEEYIITIP